MVDPKKLHSVTHRRDLGNSRYCGPAAVSIVTGRTAEAATRWILLARGYEPGQRNGGVKGSSRREIERALAAFGYRLNLTEAFAGAAKTRPTLARWLRERRPEERRQTFLVNAGWHWIIVRGNKIACSITGAPVNLSAYPARRKRVAGVARITLDGHPDAARLRRLREEPLPVRGVSV